MFVHSERNKLNQIALANIYVLVKVSWEEMNLF